MSQSLLCKIVQEITKTAEERNISTARNIASLFYLFRVRGASMYSSIFLFIFLVIQMNKPQSAPGGMIDRTYNNIKIHKLFVSIKAVIKMKHQCIKHAKPKKVLIRSMVVSKKFMQAFFFEFNFSFLFLSLSFIFASSVN